MIPKTKQWRVRIDHPQWGVLSLIVLAPNRDFAIYNTRRNPEYNYPVISAAVLRKPYAAGAAFVAIPEGMYKRVES